MRKPGRFEAVYNALAHIEYSPMTDQIKEQVREALHSPTGLLAAKAADIAGERDIRELIPDMVSAFNRFMIDGARTDKLCNAKTSIIKALNKLEYNDDSIFLTGAKYIQMEPAYCKPVDTAVDLRCNCAFALARIGNPDVHYTLTEMLVDSESDVRAASVKSLTYLGTPESELLLRLKSLVGDEEPEVTGECFAGLITMSPKRSLEFVSRFLGSDSASVAESAALAIGNSRDPEAFNILLEHWSENISPAVRRSLLLPIALIRSEESLRFLIEIVRVADCDTASTAISALSIYLDERSVSEITRVVKERNDPEITCCFEKEFGCH